MTERLVGRRTVLPQVVSRRCQHGLEGFYDISASPNSIPGYNYGFFVILLSMLKL